MAMLPRLVAVAALVALLCAAAATAQKVPAVGGAPTCGVADQNVVNACFKRFGEGLTTADVVGPGKVDCCGSFKGHSCLCLMKNALKTQGKTAANNVKCLREAAC